MMLVRLKDEFAINEERDTMMSPEFEERLNRLRIAIDTFSTNNTQNEYKNYTWYNNSITPTTWTPGPWQP